MLALAGAELRPTHWRTCPYIWECGPGVRSCEPCLPYMTCAQYHKGRLVAWPKPILRQFLVCQKYWPMKGRTWNWPVTSLTSAQSHYNGDKSAEAPCWHQPAPNLNLTSSNPNPHTIQTPRMTNPPLLSPNVEIIDILIYWERGTVSTNQYCQALSRNL